jgi:hypothetical protein
VKANSIQGSKMNDVDVIYTMWTNLKKTDGMEVGQVGIHREKEVSFKLSMNDRASVIVLNFRSYVFFDAVKNMLVQK